MSDKTDGGIAQGDQPAPTEPRRCQKCGKPENDHPHRHMFKAWAPTPRKESDRG